MNRRTIAGTTLLAYCFWVVGCATTTKQTLIRDELAESKEGKIMEVTLENGDVIRFDEIGGRYVFQGTGQAVQTMILGYTWDKRAVQIDAEKVLKVQIEKTETNTGQTILLIVVGIPAITFGLLLLYFVMVPIH
jgi:hypothetical protein